MYYQHDPRWITVKFRGPCLKCGAMVEPGDDAWFYPRKYHDKKGRLYCESCGKPMAREFQMAVEDEEFLSRQFIGGRYQ